MSRRAEPAKYALESVDRMAAVLFALEAAPELSLEQVARATGLNESSALRYLLSLSQHGLVERHDRTGLFRLGLGLLRLGTHAVENRDVFTLAEPIMLDLQRRFGESINLAMRQRDHVVLVRVRNRPDSMRKEGKAGETDPWHATSLGKAILAAMPQDEAEAIITNLPLPRYTPNTRITPEALRDELTVARRLGYAVDDEESVEGLRCIGVAVRDHGGQVHYGLSISGAKSRMDRTRMEAIGTALKEAAEDLSVRLGA